MIIKELSHISFSNLRVLSLGKVKFIPGSNRIASIEPLCFLDTDQLQMLELSKNVLTSGDNLIAGLKPLNKCLFSMLLDCNLCKMKFNVEKNPYVEV